MKVIQYFFQLFNLKKSLSLINLNFIDENIEAHYFESQTLNCQINSILRFVITFFFCLLNTIFFQITSDQNTLNLLLRLSAIFVDLILLFFQLYSIKYQSKSLNSIMKFMRSISIFILVIIPFYISFQESIEFNPANFVFCYLTYSIIFCIFMLFFNDCNAISIFFITLLNVCFILFVDYNKTSTSFNLKYLICPILILFGSTFTYKRIHDKFSRETYFDIYKYEKLIDYFIKMKNSLNINFLTLKKNHVLYFNKRFEDSLLKYYGADENNIFNILRILKNSKYNLLELIDEILESNDQDKDVFESVGQYNIVENNNIKYFEIHIRKVQMSEENIVEVIMYDLTEMKKIENQVVENKFKQKILAKIAHEFKTPLITISSMVNSIKQSRDLVEILNKMNHINNLSNYSLFLISDVIQYVSDNSDSMTILNEEIDLMRILNFSFEVLKTLIECNESKKENIQINSIFDREIEHYLFKSDEIKLKQVLLNLISNAVKFTNHGNIDLKGKINKDKKNIEIILKDTGKGINDDLKEVILNVNTGLNVDKEYNKMGSGIGLSITKNICKLLGLEISFKKRKIQGTKFMIQIPYLDDQQKIQKVKTYNSIEIEHQESLIESSFQDTVIKNYCFTRDLNHFHNNENKQFELRKDEFHFSINIHQIDDIKMSIVVIDDSKYVRQNIINLICLIFKEFNVDNFKILEGSDGIDLLNIIRNNEINNLKVKLIFVDENMEFLNGSETIQIIRKLTDNGKFPTLKIFSVTAFEDPETIKNISFSKPDGILSKPCSKSKLIKIFKSLSIIH